MNNNGWGSWLRENFDKLLLAALFVYSTIFAVYLIRTVGGPEHIAWGREMAGTILGALLGLITGHALASSRATTTVPGGGTATVTTEGKT